MPSSFRALKYLFEPISLGAAVWVFAVINESEDRFRAAPNVAAFNYRRYNAQRVRKFSQLQFYRQNR